MAPEIKVKGGGEGEKAGNQCHKNHRGFWVLFHFTGVESLD